MNDEFEDARVHSVQPPAMCDARCKCGERVSWFGDWTDHPPCPRCGYRPPTEQIHETQNKLDKARADALADWEAEEAAEQKRTEGR